ncbi:RIB43A-like with coiled-coils protein 1 isoform X1 [Siniperca chuatsi]|uniref:RIB43A-like with coiled-coils protein 1 isoform X1 n=3 Tax=Siniperca chuatsi TaxID=119488 RepID=UPI001CE04B4E|nr:RIB43A-like with coiled-coils protein 1 isoform X1 [Siniperca chuatsi]XP_044066821.1 RIB43A-like with coiled-coils protein 1 isoform X1 [Siniperca chuatsi]
MQQVNPAPPGSLETEKMYKVDLPVDQSIERAVERRRSAETTRKARIFNTRLRVMGLDLDALNQQVQEKKHQQNMDMQRDKAFDKLRKYHDEALLQQDIDEREKQAALHSDLTQYWATHQRVEDSRDADLKCGLKGAFRITIPEGELGPASMQILQGEGIGEEQKSREQMKKRERDLQAQIEEKERRHMADKHREMLVSKSLVHQDLRGVQLHALEEECKKAARIALDNYNQALSTERAEKLKDQHRREERENLAELRHTLRSDMMTECGEAAERDVGGGRPPRVLIDKWKGMSPEQLSAIHREREEQRLEKQRRRDAEKIQDAAWELQLLKLSREAEEEERRAAELRREKRLQTDRYNMQLAREQQAYEEYLNKKLYTNKPTKDYFYQFNTSSR